MIINKIRDWYRDVNKKANEDLYISVLLWAHERQETGFTWEELKGQFTLDSSQEAWVRKLFLTTSVQDRKFFEHLRNNEVVTPNQHYYALNEKGITAVINYKSLAHAEKTSPTRKNRSCESGSCELDKVSMSVLVRKCKLKVCEEFCK